MTSGITDRRQEEPVSSSHRLAGLQLVHRRRWRRPVQSSPRAQLLLDAVEPLGPALAVHDARSPSRWRRRRRSAGAGQANLGCGQACPDETRPRRGLNCLELLGVVDERRGSVMHLGSTHHEYSSRCAVLPTARPPAFRARGLRDTPGQPLLHARRDRRSGRRLLTAICDRRRPAHEQACGLR